MSNDINIEMRILQDNLCDLRKIAGWTAENLACKLGITKQTISNLETHKVKLSRIQYIAIRAVFECEIALRPENTTLRKVMGVLFDSMLYDYDAHKDEVRTAMVSVASIAAAGISGLQLYSSAVALFAPLGHFALQMRAYHSDELSLKWLINSFENDSHDESDDTESLEENTNEES